MWHSSIELLILQLIKLFIISFYYQIYECHFTFHCLRYQLGSVVLLKKREKYYNKL